MLCACIDIGTNTTRVLVAHARDGRLEEVLQQKAMTRLGRGLKAGGMLSDEQIAQTARVVEAQRQLARTLGAEQIRTVATAVIRKAANKHEFCRAVGGVEILDGEEEARLAFLGATRTLGAPLPGRVGVVDVGGGSTEIAVGTLADGVEWSASFDFGSGFLADSYLHTDPPAATELEAVKQHAAGVLEGIAPPPVQHAVAVGGSAASLRRLVGAVLEPETLQRALRVLSEAPAKEVARRFDLEAERVKLLPAGILALDAAAQTLGRPLQIGRGGLREGVLLDIAFTSH
jgi:exopolyphosphatase / guanosine-5'-triphosphate,3'-diphosphate pyrophosphatase